MVKCTNKQGGAWEKKAKVTYSWEKAKVTFCKIFFNYPDIFSHQLLLCQAWLTQNR